jgi:hypothetical protein
MDLEFGDAVLVKQSDGTEQFAHYLAGPRAHEGGQVIWVCDDHEWTNATVHFGSDPEGTPVCTGTRPAIRSAAPGLIGHRARELT